MTTIKLTPKLAREMAAYVRAEWCPEWEMDIRPLAGDSSWPP